MLPGLTNRENDILKLIADGLNDQEISSRLKLSEASLENHICHIFATLGISNRSQAVAYSYRTRIIFGQNDRPETITNASTAC